jgi:hypothetical protein
MVADLIDCRLPIDIDDCGFGTGAQSAIGNLIRQSAIDQIGNHQSAIRDRL